jgi:hypothetical protein
LASAAIAQAVLAVVRRLGALAPWQRLALEVAFGGACYAGLLLVFARDALRELVGLAERRPVLPRAAAA